MPELPEVETMARDLAPRLVGRRIRAPYLTRPKLADAPHLLAAIDGARIDGVSRRGKTIVISAGSLALLLAPRMTGAPRVDPPGSTPRLHDHFGFDLVAGRRVEGSFRWRDPRMFGRIRLAVRDAGGVLVDGDGRPSFANLGPEPLEIGAPGIVAALAAKPRRGAKAALLDQRVIAGIGNIYADEALHLAGIHPALLIGRVARVQLASLGDHIVALLEAGIADRGARVSSYAPPEGGAAMQLRLVAYGRAGLPCVRCGTSLRRSITAGRTTVHCPACQPEAR